MTEKEVTALVNNFNTVYERLVDETENSYTLHDRVKNQKLKDLLELCEFIRGEEESPLDKWFGVQS